MSQIEMSRSCLCSCSCFLEFEPHHQEMQLSVDVSHNQMETGWKNSVFLVCDNSEPPWHAPSTDSETEFLVQLHSMNLSHLFPYVFRPETPPQVVLHCVTVHHSIVVIWNSGSSEQNIKNSNRCREMDSFRGTLRPVPDSRLLLLA